jgi:hypothetical protein
MGIGIIDDRKAHWGPEIRARISGHVRLRYPLKRRRQRPGRHGGTKICTHITQHNKPSWLGGGLTSSSSSSQQQPQKQPWVAPRLPPCLLLNGHSLSSPAWQPTVGYSSLAPGRCAGSRGTAAHALHTAVLVGGQRDSARNFSHTAYSLTPRSFNSMRTNRICHNGLYSGQCR